MKEEQLNQRRIKRGLLLWMVVAVYLILTGCANFGSYSLNQAVIKYDNSVLQSEQQVLLSNIIRMHDDQPPHFTVASSISATFTLTGTGTLGPLSIGSSGINTSTGIGTSHTSSGSLSLGTTVSESPLITISPMQGKDYAERLLKPIDTKFVTTHLMQRSEPILDKMLRLIGKNFYLMGPTSTKEIFDKVKNIPLRDFKLLPLTNSEGEIVYYKYPFFNTGGLNNVWKDFRDFKDKKEKELKELRKQEIDLKDLKDNEKELKELRKQEIDLKDLKDNEKELKELRKQEIDLKKSINEEKNKFHKLIVDEKRAELEDKGGFTPDEADCILDTSDGCYMENKPQIIPEGEKNRRKDTRHYELFRKLVLYIQAMALTNRLSVSSIDFYVPEEGTFKASDDSKSKPIAGGDATTKQDCCCKDNTSTSKSDNFADIVGALEKNYNWQDAKMTVNDIEKNGSMLTKRYSIIAITDFDFDDMTIEDRKGLIKKIQDDFELNAEINLDEGMIIVLFRGDPDKTIDYSYSWPIYGYFTVRNFNQVLQFVAESLEDRPGYAREYNVSPSKFTEKLLCKFMDALAKDASAKEELPRLRLDNPELTLTITSGATSPKDSLVDVNYNDKNCWISPLQGEIGLYVNPYPRRWNGQVFKMLYEMFQFNRNEPAVSTPTVSIPNK